MRLIARSLIITSLLAAACGSVEDDAKPSKDDARVLASHSSIDWCEVYGWYGDGICDEFCALPDPDCEPAPTGCYNDDDCAGDEVCNLEQCAPCPEGMVCPAVCVGVCEPALPEPPAGDCGGLAGLSCDEGEYCAYPPEASCGAADQMGTCTPRPEACIMVYDPVCGCDGNTYGNACTAASAGVSVAYAGECEPVDPPPPPAGDCGGLGGLACDEGEYCAYPPEASCGAADQLGTCAPRPEVCTKIYAPVCGCDDQTYGNACMAANAGVSVAYEGECAPTEPAPTCDGYCGGAGASGTCYCDALCESYGDCCGDYGAFCS